ncbi:MAG: DUF5018 domain-containing protein [Bacteroidales bacterium]|jgi:hypothetical protein|nr:DUF5018 domain-containing protein [Bacteroidales bacterium]
MTNLLRKGFSFRNALMALLGGIMFCFTSCKDDDPKSNACDLVTFTVSGESWTIDGTSITHTYPNGADVTALAPTITVSPGATVSPASGAAQDFSAAAGVTYWVTAEDGSTKKQYTAKATVAPPNASKDCDITAFAVGEANWTINGTNITHTYPAGTNVTALAPTITLSANATVNPASGAAQDFSAANGVTYTVTAQDGTTKKTYTAKATVEPSVGTGAEILSFTVNGEAWTINGTNIIKFFPNGTPITNLTPTITLSAGATVNPASDAAQNFFTEQGVTYTVTAGDETTTKEYTVKTTVLGPAVLSGTTGECTWVLSGEEGNYFLTISGNGAMGDNEWKYFFGYNPDDEWPEGDYSGIKAVIVENGVTALSDWVFSSFQNLTSVTLPESVTSLGDGFLTRSGGIVSMTILNVETLGYGFLGWVSALTSVTIPSSVQSLGEAAFADCYNLTTVTCLNPAPPTLNGSGHFRFGADDVPDPDEPFCILRVPAGSVDAYKNSSWGELVKFANIVAIEE